MKVEVRNNGNEYTMWLNAIDTQKWANKTGARWPGATIAGHACFVEVDQNGLCAFSVYGLNDDEVNMGELEALVHDHSPNECEHLWPLWLVKR